ncbi:MAG: adenylate/guanylate cyclase domain-containing protein [Acidimicrobiia bacterium]|nr:adenylate/guanylate cyclase domain-containing protein [Acidimicrobiia bacterium]MBT8246975.1 adenylate/guanylate cyclase domain-containing protein [Acidimicrobiia bacterium]NNJ46360.1 adenylate/guanylate cyclase domain-containing protein [Acidimicrobiia bacterium]NNL12625.1 adenylate/guanylate cyclase domain-containing protein [Acidimicrobiia bacterium]RZV46162.1 MAG: adenylate/guanylate cyclase domain-containing protein [Acidimicrobiia bacterium]
MPTTHYTMSGDVNIAYQVFGEGEHDLVYVPGWISNVELMWDDPVLAGILRRLGTFARVITFDKRGTGMSDRVPVNELPHLEQRMDDVRAVMDAVGSEKATLFGHSEGGSMATLFAATYPERTEGLILASTYAKRVWSEDHPWAPTAEARAAEIEHVEATWGDPNALPVYVLGARGTDTAFREWVARYFRLSASPKAAAQLLRMNTEMDTRAALPLIHAPTLCLYRTDDVDVSVEEGRWIASQIPNATFVELPGDAHLFWAVDPQPFVDEIEDFMTGYRTSGEPERVLATVLFTDIVDSTKQAAELGDQAWRSVLESHNRITRQELRRWRGAERGTTGDGFLATFDGPARAVRAAAFIARAVSALGVQVRAGVHTGEVELVGDDVAGLAVHIGARIAAMAGPGEVYASQTVRDLVVGSELQFESRGRHELKGVPGEWEIYSVVEPAAAS